MIIGDVSNVDRNLNYELIRQIEEHAKKFDMASDKKTFLKQVSAYEQKYILLNSSEPYEVLMYLDQIDSKETQLVLNELTQDEIVSIINLFTSSQKKDFYNNFTNLELVNKFIKYDKNAKEHIQNLEFDRKIEIIDASKKETIKASSTVYESLETEEKQLVPDLITDVDAIVTLESTNVYQETNLQQDDVADQTSESQETNDDSFIEEIQQELQVQVDEEKNEIQSEDKLEDENKKDIEEFKNEPEQPQIPDLVNQFESTVIEKNVNVAPPKPPITNKVNEAPVMQGPLPATGNEILTVPELNANVKNEPIPPLVNGNGVEPLPEQVDIPENEVHPEPELTAGTDMKKDNSDFVAVKNTTEQEFINQIRENLLLNELGGYVKKK